MPKCYASPKFLQRFWWCKSCKFFQWFKVLPKMWFINVYVFEYEHSKRFVWKDDDIFAYKRKIGNKPHFRAGGDSCLLYMCNGRQTNPSTYIFPSFPNSYHINLLFNSRDIMVEPILTECALIFLILIGMSFGWD